MTVVFCWRHRAAKRTVECQIIVGDHIFHCFCSELLLVVTDCMLFKSCKISEIQIQ